jgi:hypothetical protein
MREIYLSGEIINSAVRENYIRAEKSYLRDKQQRTGRTRNDRGPSRLCLKYPKTACTSRQIASSPHFSAFARRPGISNEFRPNCIIMYYYY